MNDSADFGEREEVRASFGLGSRVEEEDRGEGEEDMTNENCSWALGSIEPSRGKMLWYIYEEQSV